MKLRDEDARASAPQRLGDLIDALFGYCGDMSVFVAQIIRNLDPDIEQAIREFNADIPSIVNARAQQGRKIVTVDLYSAVSAKDMKDKTHPNDQGYIKMAKKWQDAIVEQSKKGWF